MKKRLLLIWMIILGAGSFAFGQDIHFSQFMQSPMNLNPALTGQFDGDYRGIGNHRHQWRAVTVPYVTFGISGDARNFLGYEGVNTGVSIYHDKTGDSRFTTLHFNLLGSYSYAIDSIQSITGGLALGFTQRSQDYTDLQFDNQYNGFAYDSSIDPQENFARNSRLYLNVNLGAAYRWAPEKRKNFGVGISGYNLTTPRQSFFDDNNIVLDRRFNFHADGQFAVAKKFDVLPALSWSAQGTYRELMLGGRGKYIAIDENGVYRAFYAGIFMRAADAGYLVGGMDYDNWYFGLSYDINYSNLVPASNNRGALELSVIYIFRKLKPTKVKHIICPNYI